MWVFERGEGKGVLGIEWFLMNNIDGFKEEFNLYVRRERLCFGRL